MLYLFIYLFDIGFNHVTTMLQLRPFSEPLSKVTATFRGTMDFKISFLGVFAETDK